MFFFFLLVIYPENIVNWYLCYFAFMVVVARYQEFKSPTVYFFLLLLIEICPVVYLKAQFTQIIKLLFTHPHVVKPVRVLFFC